MPKRIGALLPYPYSTQSQSPTWKVFNDILPAARDRYFSRLLSEINTLLSNELNSPTDRYWDINEYVRKQDKEINNVFDRHSRRAALLTLLQLRREGCAQEDEVSRFTPQTRELSSRSTGNACATRSMVVMWKTRRAQRPAGRDTTTPVAQVAN